MSEEKKDNALSTWFSTYGFITAERILGIYGIQLPQKELRSALANKYSFYHRLLEIPLKNVFNGMILQQAQDYHIYLQKLFVDYLISGEADKPAEGPGSMTRIELADEEKTLQDLTQSLHDVEAAHHALIATSQKETKHFAKQWVLLFAQCIASLHGILKKEGKVFKKREVKLALELVFIHAEKIQVLDSATVSFLETFCQNLSCVLQNDIKKQMHVPMQALVGLILSLDEHLSEYLQKTEEINQLGREKRTEFYQAILRCIELFHLLPEYQIDAEQDLINREFLHFDNRLGEESAEAMH